MQALIAVRVWAWIKQVDQDWGATFLLTMATNRCYCSSIILINSTTWIFFHNPIHTCINECIKFLFFFFQRAEFQFQIKSLTDHTCQRVRRHRHPVSNQKLFSVMCHVSMITHPTAVRLVHSQWLSVLPFYFSIINSQFLKRVKNDRQWVAG